MKVGELIDRISNLYSKGLPSDDSRLSNRFIYNKLLTVRSRLIVQELNKKRSLSSWMYQRLHCIQLVEVDATENCPCVPPSGCYVLRTKYKLPKPISGLYNANLRFVGTLLGKRIQVMSSNSIPFLKGNKYSKDISAYFESEGYLYVVANKRLEFIMAEGVFEDPLEVKDFLKHCNKEQCTNCNSCESFLDQEFPLEAALIEPLIELSLQELIEIFYKTREDLTNNSADTNQINNA